MQVKDALDGFHDPDDPVNDSSEGPFFALAPERDEINTPINYSTHIGAELYRSGSSLLLIHFYGEEETLSVFTDGLMD